MAAKSYTVVAPLVIAKNDEGGDVYLYQGSPVPDGQSDAWIQDHLDSEMIATDKDAVDQLGDQGGAGIDVPDEPKSTTKK